MFSEHVGRSKEKGSTKKKAGKDLKFDELDVQKAAKEMSTVKIDEKREASELKEKEKRKTIPEYSPQPEKKEKNKEKEHGADLFKKIAKNETAKAHDHLKKDAVGLGLYETANVMCSIVDITKDSTIKRNKNVPPPPSEKQPKKTSSRASLMSQNSVGPFAQLKENVEKKRKSFDEEES